MFRGLRLPIRRPPVFCYFSASLDLFSIAATSADLNRTMPRLAPLRKIAQTPWLLSTRRTVDRLQRQRSAISPSESNGAFAPSIGFGFIICSGISMLTLFTPLMTMYKSTLRARNALLSRKNVSTGQRNTYGRGGFAGFGGSEAAIRTIVQFDRTTMLRCPKVTSVRLVLGSCRRMWVVKDLR